MDGYDALQYSRLRYIDSDWKRIERQRNVIQAVVHKAKDLSLLELNDVANTILPMINTNLSKTEILDLVLFAVLRNRYWYVILYSATISAVVTGTAIVVLNFYISSSLIFPSCSNI